MTSSRRSMFRIVCNRLLLGKAHSAYINCAVAPRRDVGGCPARLLRMTREAMEVMSIEQLNQLALRLAVELDGTAAAKGHQTGYAASLERELGRR